MTEQGKRISDSQVTISQVMLPTDANAYGNVHGGVIMKLVDDAGAIVATRHSRSIVVTVAVDSMTFLSPIYVGNLGDAHRSTQLCRPHIDGGRGAGGG